MKISDKRNSVVAIAPARAICELYTRVPTHNQADTEYSSLEIQREIRRRSPFDHQNENKRLVQHRQEGACVQFMSVPSINMQAEKTENIRCRRAGDRQTWVNGPRPPVGYRAVEVPPPQQSGMKKQLEVEESEVVVVNRILQWYLHGDLGKSLAYIG